jgi:diacylglycerol kinase family enzyme
MRIAVVANPSAGRGEGARMQPRFVEALRAAGHDAWPVTLTPGEARPLADAARQGDVLVLIGGDGTIHHALPHLADAKAALWHCPAGTENLFARELGADRSAAALVDALARRDVWRIDLGTANGRRFLLMGSIGFDAEVVHDLAARRGGRISHLSYAGPIARQVRRWRPPRLSASVDGATIAEGEPGMIVVANCRQYAMRIDPAPRASMIDGRLDVVFFPVRGRLDLLRWVAAARRGAHVRDPRLRYRCGRAVVIACASPQLHQLDGDPPAPDAIGERSDRLELTVERGALPVLAPALFGAAPRARGD